jgi:hypothetical protein
MRRARDFRRDPDETVTGCTFLASLLLLDTRRVRRICVASVAGVSILYTAGEMPL